MATTASYTTPRGPSSRAELEIEWQFPVFEGRRIADERSRAVHAAALPAEKAYAFLAGDDPRPLLVLRECLTCTGTDDALLTRGADNEKTFLMSRWFRCVKVPPDVLEDDHPFHALFPGDDPGHLFVARADGSERVDLTGEQSRTELWKAMGTLLTSQYESKPGYEGAVKALLKVLDELDGIDEKILSVNERLDATIEKHGPESRKLKKLEKELAKLESQRGTVLDRASKISRLKLREPESVPEVAETG